MTVVLRTEGLSKQWGSFAANSGIDLSIAAGSRHALIGPNGAGKTTFINLLTGVHPASSGRILLDGRDITALPQHQRVRRGMTRSYQINTLFADLTVLEAVVLAVCTRRGSSACWWRTVAAHGEEVAEAMALLVDLGLGDAADTLTRQLAYGRQRLLEIALALATRPRLLLLDEPAAGIPLAESRELFAVLERLPRDVTLLFIEHDMELVFRFAERITVLVAGRVLADGTPAAIAADPRVREVYLGEASRDD
jgi:branched-chain amino acid transport system ATP-binding protein